MKVHFAGYMPFTQAVDAAGVRYVLDTFYELRVMPKKACQEHVEKLNLKKHSIVDSGLFTLMFGARASSKLTEEFFEKWQTEYAEWVNKVGFKHSIVECDVQKKISPAFAWDLRRRMKKLVKNQVINVYHLEDENPDKLIDFADYIAVSIPELRRNVTKKEMLSVCDYITRKAIGKGKRVHLLGCTEAMLMQRYSFCTSCDSTSWLSGNRYNNFLVRGKRVESPP